MHISVAQSPADLELIRQLFREYAAEIQVEKCFVDFEQELVGLPGEYAPPAGRLLLAREGDEVTGCVACRPFGADACEMKRLYVRPAHRGDGTGRALATRLVAEARAAGYQRMLLDTVPKLAPAIRLYESLGFLRRDSYYEPPEPGTVCMELRL